MNLYYAFLFLKELKTFIKEGEQERERDRDRKLEINFFTKENSKISSSIINDS